MVALIIFPVILQTTINLIMLSTGGQGPPSQSYGDSCHIESHSVACHPTQENAPRLKFSRPALDLSTP